MNFDNYVGIPESAIQSVFDLIKEKYPNLFRNLQIIKAYHDPLTHQEIFVARYNDGTERNWIFTTHQNLSEQFQDLENNLRPKGAWYYHKRGDV